MINGGCVVVVVVVVGAVIFSVVCFYSFVVPLTSNPLLLLLYILSPIITEGDFFSTVTGMFLVTTNIVGTSSPSYADFVMVFLVLAR